MNTIKSRGIVIKEVYIGEADKIINILLKDYGKLSVTAKRSRHPKSKLLAGTSLFTYSEFIIFPGKKHFILEDAEPIESYYSIRNELDRLSYASYFIELTDKCILEAVSCNDILLLILKTLLALTKSVIQPALIARIFEIKLLQLNGYMPVTTNCVICQKEVSDNLYFGSNGLLCSNCQSRQSFKIEITDTILYTVQYILSSELNRLFNFNVDKNTLKILNIITENFIKSHLCVNLKTYDFIKELEKLNQM